MSEPSVSFRVSKMLSECFRFLSSTVLQGKVHVEFIDWLAVSSHLKFLPMALSTVQNLKLMSLLSMVSTHGTKRLMLIIPGGSLKMKKVISGCVIHSLELSQTHVCFCTPTTHLRLLGEPKRDSSMKPTHYWRGYFWGEEMYWPPFKAGVIGLTDNRILKGHWSSLVIVLEVFLSNRFVTLRIIDFAQLNWNHTGFGKCPQQFWLQRYQRCDVSL